MKRIVDVITRAAYILLGSFFLLLGITVLLLGTGILPLWVHDQIFEMTHGDPFTLHLLQETATFWILACILLFWFAWHFEKSMKFHWAMTIFLFLDAFVHWFSAFGEFEFGLRALVNAIPFFIFLALGLLRHFIVRDLPAA